MPMCHKRERHCNETEFNESQETGSDCFVLLEGMSGRHHIKVLIGSVSMLLHGAFIQHPDKDNYLEFC